MGNTTPILTIISALFFVAPFFIWGVIRFLDKNKQKVLYWKKTAIILSFSICFSIGILLIVLAIVL